jgi:hypothetical protein
MTHIHIEIPWLSDEYRATTATTIFGALDALAYELDNAADYERSSISALGDGGDYEGAYEAWKACEALSNVLANIRSVVGQKDGTRPRAPLYSGEDGDALLQESAERFLDGGTYHFDYLPMRYTPYLSACTVEDCEWMVADDDD